MRLRKLAAFFLGLSLSASAAFGRDDVTIPSLPYRPPAKAEVVARFMSATLANPALTAEQRKAVVQELAGAKTGEDDFAMTKALTNLYPAFGKSLAAFADEEFDKAIPSLMELAKSPDAYLAAHAEFYLARAYMTQENFEAAIALFDKLAGPAKFDKTLSAGEALFYKGICQDKLLDRNDAIVSLATYLRQNPDAPERLWVAASHRVEELKFLVEGSLFDVTERMDFSRRHLDLKWSGDPTQKEQGNIIAMLEKLIKEAEEKENQGGGGGGGGGGQGQGQANGPRNNNPSSPAQNSQAPEGSSEAGALHRVNRGNAADTWGDPKKKEKAEVIKAFQAKFPSRYRQAVEEYYRRLQEGPED